MTAHPRAVRALPATAAAFAVLLLASGAWGEPPTPTPATTAEVLAAVAATGWRPLDPEHTLYLEVPGGRVVLELAPWFAPRHVASIEALARRHYFDGLAIVRAQDNYVVQWGDPAGGTPEARPLGISTAGMPAELDRAVDPELPWTPLPDGDVYAPEVGFVHELPAARDPATGRLWLAHCYGMVGVGRDVPPDPGSGAELYVVIGHAPRHLDRNVTLVGRVVAGIEHLSTLPRGSEDLGFYATAAQQVPVLSVRLAAELPEAQREPLEVLRTDTPTFTALVASRRYRREPWFADPVGRVEVCNVPLPVRRRPEPAAAAGDSPPPPSR